MAKSTINVDIDAFKQDIHRYAEMLASNAAKIAAEKLTKRAQEEIERFYNDYDPTVYLRTDNLKNHSYERYYRNRFSREYVGGVNISPDEMHQYYSDTHDEHGGLKEFGASLNFDFGYGGDYRARVVDYAWNKGAHGTFESKIPKYTNPTPMESLMEYHDSDELIDEIMDEAIGAAKAQARRQGGFYYNYDFS